MPPVTNPSQPVLLQLTIRRRKILTALCGLELALIAAHFSANDGSKYRDVIVLSILVCLYVLRTNGKAVRSELPAASSLARHDYRTRTRGRAVAAWALAVPAVLLLMSAASPLSGLPSADGGRGERDGYEADYGPEDYGDEQQAGGSEASGFWQHIDSYERTQADGNPRNNYSYEGPDKEPPNPNTEQVDGYDRYIDGD